MPIACEGATIDPRNLIRHYQSPRQLLDLTYFQFRINSRSFIPSKLSIRKAHTCYLSQPMLNYLTNSHTRVRYTLILMVCLVLPVTHSCSENERTTEQLLIAASANVQFAMEEIIELFHNETGLDCEIIVASSGKLTAQIMEGAPYDVFISADLKYPNTLFGEGKTTGQPITYAYGKLVLWTLDNDINLSLKSLELPSINHIALANPINAPYGVAADEVLRHSGLYDRVLSKLVYGESISQTNQFILSRAAEIGFTAKAVVLSQQMKTTGQWVEIPENLYSPIEQGVVAIHQGRGQNAFAKDFCEFLVSTQAKKILLNYGYDFP